MSRPSRLPALGLGLVIVATWMADAAVAQLDPIRAPVFTPAEYAQPVSTVAPEGPGLQSEPAAHPRLEARLAGSDIWTEEATTEQQRGLSSTFFLRVTNDGPTPGSFAVRGDRGGAGFAVRYLDGGAGDERITAAVVSGSFVLLDVPPGASRVLRLRVRVLGRASVDVAGAWTVLAASATDPATADPVTVGVRTVTQAFARAAGVTLRVPAREAAITFHESLFGSAAALLPLGRLLRNANPRFEPPRDGPGPGYVVMGSRGRGTPPTSGSDDVVSADEPILAPVSGTVTRVTSYRLYCRWADVRIAIRPDEAPGRTVQVFHVLHPRVRVGEHVVVSSTVLGRARLFPFKSQTQSYGLGGRHVHLEVERDGGAPLPGCDGRPVTPPRDAAGAEGPGRPWGSSPFDRGELP